MCDLFGFCLAFHLAQNLRLFSVLSLALWQGSYVWHAVILDCRALIAPNFKMEQIREYLTTIHGMSKLHQVLSVQRHSKTIVVSKVWEISVGI